MKYCCIPNCKSSNRKDKKISFFQFPSTGKQRLAWLQAISEAKLRDSSWMPTGYTVVCEKHFTKTDFSKATKKKMLLPTSVISNLTIQKSEDQESKPKKRKSMANYSELFSKEDKISAETYRLAAEIYALSRQEVNGVLIDDLNPWETPAHSSDNDKIDSASNLAPPASIEAYTVPIESHTVPTEAHTVPIEAHPDNSSLNQFSELSPEEQNKTLSNNPKPEDTQFVVSGKSYNVHSIVSSAPLETRPGDRSSKQIPKKSQKQRRDCFKSLDAQLRLSSHTFPASSSTSSAFNQPRYPNCCVRGCNTGSETDRLKQKELGQRVYSVFYAPLGLLPLWKKIVPVSGLGLTRRHGVCELHFAEKYLERISVTAVEDAISIRPKLGLVPIAVPSIFPGDANKKIIISHAESSKNFNESSNYSAMLNNIVDGKKLIMKARPSDIEAAKLKLQTPEGMFLSSLILNNMSSSDVNTLKSSSSQNVFSKMIEFLDRPRDLGFVIHQAASSSTIKSTLSSSAVPVVPAKEAEKDKSLVPVKKTENYKNMSVLAHFKLLKEDVTKIELPPNWSAVQCFPTLLPIVKWNENYSAERKFSIDYNFKLKVYLGNREVCFEHETPKSPQDILAFLPKVDSLQLCKGCFDMAVPNCLGVVSSKAPSSPYHRGLCDNCILHKRMKARKLWQTIHHHFIYKKKVQGLIKEHEKWHGCSYRAQKRLERLKRQLKVEETCSSVALDFFT